ncbi:hypothetical protein PoB_002605400 [Plakobranchus ocellatus]|uniref:Uncharacterized protein n=1 Tax=Plakobranchus ocellatus TaxID=259542 RepID=A0AAV4A014_9GAST|nr:hypothetical protein PoB_002605400 [Plakobranchus ocellatus]
MMEESIGVTHPLSIDVNLVKTGGGWSDSCSDICSRISVGGDGGDGSGGGDGGNGSVEGSSDVCGDCIAYGVVNDDGDGDDSRMVEMIVMICSTSRLCDGKLGAAHACRRKRIPVCEDAKNLKSSNRPKINGFRGYLHEMSAELNGNGKKELMKAKRRRERHPEALTRITARENDVILILHLLAGTNLQKVCQITADELRPHKRTLKKLERHRHSRYRKATA